MQRGCSLLHFLSPLQNIAFYLLQYLPLQDSSRMAKDCRPIFKVGVVLVGVRVLGSRENEE